MSKISNLTDKKEQFFKITPEIESDFKEAKELTILFFFFLFNVISIRFTEVYLKIFKIL